VYKVDEGRPTWPVCHVIDTAALYIDILRGILDGRDIGFGKNGYFLAASGSVAWEDLYSVLAKALKKRGAIDDADVQMADLENLKTMGEGIGRPAEFVPVELGGL
jgi:acetyl-CoA acetyltransferase